MPHRKFVVSVIVLGIGVLTFIGIQPAHTQFSGPRTRLQPQPSRVNREAEPMIGTPTISVHPTEAAMSRPVSWHFVDVPLSDLCAELRRTLQINVLLDNEALTEEGIATDTPVTIHLDNVPLEVALQHTLRPLQLAASVHRHVLVVTTIAKEKEILVTRVYPVYDLVVFQTPNGERHEDFQSLMNVIEQETSGPWMNTAGEGGGMTELANAGALVIRQTYDVHRQVAGLLTALRKAKHVQQLPDIPVVIPDNGQPEYRSAGFFSVDENEEIDVESVGRTIQDATPVRSAPAVRSWQLPRVDRAD